MSDSGRGDAVTLTVPEGRLTCQYNVCTFTCEHVCNTHMLSWLPHGSCFPESECHTHTHTHSLPIVSRFAGQVPGDQGKSAGPALSDSKAVLYAKEPTSSPAHGLQVPHPLPRPTWYPRHGQSPQLLWELWSQMAYMTTFICLENLLSIHQLSAQPSLPPGSLP